MYWELAYLGTFCHCNYLCRCHYNFGHHILGVHQSFLFWFLDHRSHYNWRTLTICSQLNRCENIKIMYDDSEAKKWNICIDNWLTWTRFNLATLCVSAVTILATMFLVYINLSCFYSLTTGLITNGELWPFAINWTDVKT